MSSITAFAENKTTQLVLKNPELKFFKSARSDVEYVGPRSLSDLTSFINKQIGRVTSTTIGMYVLCSKMKL